MDLAVTWSYLDQFASITPLEHTLIHQLIQLKLRFLQPSGPLPGSPFP